MKSFLTIVIVLIIAAAGAFYYLQFDQEKEQATQPTKTEPLPLPQDTTPDIQHPITEPPVIIDSSPADLTEELPSETVIEEPLPPLEDSDNQIKEILSNFFGDKLISQILNQTGFIHRFVVTIDSLPKKKLATKYRVIPPTAGKFLVHKETNDTFTIDQDNFERYSMYMQLLSMLDTEQFVKWYKRYYPLIQEAYDGLGYKNLYFNDRFIFVIDHLLRTPTIEGQIQLVQPKVFYEYADPALERLSAGQKILLRIGPENRAIVEAKLTEIRKELATP
ncbi:MAG: DUF3014 domain-containing protein [Gammaproteobacteria bacterium]|jgi:hypothetical protein